jgi:hypothetical protein
MAGTDDVTVGKMYREPALCSRVCSGYRATQQIAVGGNGRDLGEGKGLSIATRDRLITGVPPDQQRGENHKHSGDERRGQKCDPDE